MAETANQAPARWISVLLVAWLLPGGGHFLQRRTIRGALLLASTGLMFLFGLMMRGAFFEPQRGDLLTTVIYYGGFLANVASGAFYILAVALGYNQPDVAGHVHDYGTKFLVGAGLLNILAMVDAYEIARGNKS
jgi:hypothetical protein